MIKLQLLVQQICLLNIILNVTKKKNWKTVRLYRKSFSKTTIAMRFNHQACPFVPMLFLYSFIPSFFNVLSIFFFSRFTLWVTVPTVRILIQPLIKHTVISKSMTGRIRKQIVHQILLICTTSNVHKTVWRTCKLIIDFNQLCSLTKLVHTIPFLKTKILFYE